MKSFVSIAKNATVRTAVIAALIASTLAASAGAAEKPVIVDSKTCVVVVSFDTLSNGTTKVTKSWSCEKSENKR